MALYTKQEFSPPVLSRKWIAMKFRPNMLMHSRRNVVSILESGLLFREDSIELEQETPSAEAAWRAAGGGGAGWLTRGEALASAVAVAVCVGTFPPRSLNRSALLNLALYLSVPASVVALRARARGSLETLLDLMRRYLARARRAQACVKECMALHNSVASIASVVESTHTLLCRQQSELSVLMARTSSALLGNVPWLRADVNWDAVSGEKQDNLMKIHHAFLVIQSTLLKHIAMAHFIPSPHVQRIYKNHNERLYWIHYVLIQHLIDEFRENLEVLERMYRLLRNIGSGDVTTNKKPGAAIVDSWLYSDVHNGIAKTSMELKLATNKCNDLDIFLDSCALNKQDIDLDVLSKDVDEIIECITNCLSTVQNSQIRLRKIKGKVSGGEREVNMEETKENDDVEVVRIEDKDPEIKDEVFYFVKTEDDEVEQPPTDVTTGPGKKERDATKIVLGELKRKLGKREDVMRERERQALRKTMPEFKDKVPEFPRQIKFEEFVDLKGYISKISKRRFKNKDLKKRLKKKDKSKINKKYRLKTKKFTLESDITEPLYEANSKLNFKSRLISVNKLNKHFLITKWVKRSEPVFDCGDFSDLSEDFSDIEASAANRIANGSGSQHKNNNGYDAKNFTCTKRDLELSNCSSDSDSDYQERMELLKDVRRHRVQRKKNYPDKRASIDKSIDMVDESLKPIEYSFGTGMAMASMLQLNNNGKLANMVQEEVFMGDGELSEDSGNDADA